MAKRWFSLMLVTMLVAWACGGPGATTRPSGAAPTAGGSPAASEPAASEPAASEPAASEPAPVESVPATPATAECEVETPAEVDDTVTGDLKLIGWSAGQVELGLLDCVLRKFEAK